MTALSILECHDSRFRQSQNCISMKRKTLFPRRTQHRTSREIRSAPTIRRRKIKKTRTAEYHRSKYGQPPLYIYLGTSSTRRFLARPSSVVFTATGARLATPLAVNRLALIPNSFTRVATTASARRLERASLVS